MKKTLIKIKGTPDEISAKLAQLLKQYGKGATLADVARGTPWHF